MHERAYTHRAAPACKLLQLVILTDDVIKHAYIFIILTHIKYWCSSINISHCLRYLVPVSCHLYAHFSALGEKSSVKPLYFMYVLLYFTLYNLS